MLTLLAIIVFLMGVRFLFGEGPLTFRRLAFLAAAVATLAVLAAWSMISGG